MDSETREFFLQYEWIPFFSGDTLNWYYVCVFCKNEYEQGHKECCKMSIFLKDAKKNTQDDLVNVKESIVKRLIKIGAINGKSNRYGVFVSNPQTIQ